MSDFEKLLRDVDLSGLPDPPEQQSVIGEYTNLLDYFGFRRETPEEQAERERRVARSKRDYIHALAAELRLTKKERKRLFKEEDQSAALFAAALMLRDRIAELEGGR
jgi:hypothetical protein